MNELKINPWSESIWFSPCCVIEELSRAAAEKRSLKQYKEAWICAVAFICHSHVSNKEWWIQIPKKDPPDVLAMELVNNPDQKGQSLSVVNVEVFEISSHDSTESIQQSIERKIGKKDYSQMTLIGFVRRRGLFDHVDLAKKIQDLSPKVQNLWLLVREENNTNISFIALFPDLLKFKADFGKWCKESNQEDFIEMIRGMNTKRKPSTIEGRPSLMP